LYLGKHKFKLWLRIFSSFCDHRQVTAFEPDKIKKLEKEVSLDRINTRSCKYPEDRECLKFKDQKEAKGKKQSGQGREKSESEVGRWMDGDMDLTGLCNPV
jgi:hypothetical protein